MKELNSDRLAELVTAALERTAFVISEPISADDAAELPELTHFTKIRYHGPTIGHIHLAASEGFVRELASSLLGVEPESVSPDIEGKDALTELANIMGGSVVLDMGGENCEFSLGLPEYITLSDSADPSSGKAVCYLDSEDELLRIVWVPDPPVKAAA